MLPCGARIYITYSGKHVLTQVIDRGPTAPDREFELTDALARLLGLTGVQRIRWSYAAAPDVSRVSPRRGLMTERLRPAVTRLQSA